MTRRPLLLFMLASLAVGLVLMLVFEATVTRIVGRQPRCSRSSSRASS